MYHGWGWGWRPYVPVWKRRAQALKKMEKLRKKGVNIQPVKVEGRRIARTFWGQAWCEHLEKFSDYENRLPRGRTYVRNGSVCHLDIHKGAIEAKVSGSDIYDIRIGIKPLPKNKWRRVRDSCTGRIGSLLELLQGRLSDHVMNVVTDKNQGLFPLPQEISLHCSCPDWAVMCKHVAAAMYGVGSRLDEKPELLFLLRGVDHQELVSADMAESVVTKTSKTGRKTLDESELSEVFGIEVAPVVEVESGKTGRRRQSAKTKTADNSPRKRPVATKKPKPGTAERPKTKKSARKPSGRKKTRTAKG